MDRDALVEAVVGSSVAQGRARRVAAGGALVLEATGLWGMKLADVSFTLGRGEMLGVAGLVGSGRSELARIVFGHQAALAGRISLAGRDVTSAPTAERIAAGVGYVPQTRAQGLFLPSSVRDNIVLADLAPLMDGPRLSPAREADAAVAMADGMRVKAAGLEAAVATLSGGNQQKVALPKWLRRDLSLLILDEPTQGIDVGARTEIFRTIQDLAERRGFGVLVLDSDLEILTQFCGRVLTMSGGRLGPAFEGDHLDVAALERAVYGH